MNLRHKTIDFSTEHYIKLQNYALLQSKFFTIKRAEFRDIKAQISEHKTAEFLNKRCKILRHKTTYFSTKHYRNM
ncbi:hypothetical protein Hdeb2414_s0005g00160621 [Helianthus debilis subsp. tardiflorus]